MPADSVSRRIAEAVPVDTLRLLWRSSGPDDAPMEHPRTVRFGRGDTLFVSDVERNSIFAFSTSAGEPSELAIPGLDVPYLAGVSGDTLAVFNPAPLRVDFLAGGRPVRSVAIRDDGRTESSLVYAAVAGAVYYKRVSPNAEGIVAAVGDSGAIVRSIPLEGPHWRRAGQLRMWGDSLISLSGFRPVVDVVSFGHADTREVDIGVDTLALRGFDSPMLARSRSFLMGGTHEAPLLSPAAAAAGDLLFVLNLRPGWLQVDVFDRDGMLLRRLTQPEQTYNSSYYPQDLDVRRTARGDYEIAVVLTHPTPSLELYRFSVPRSLFPGQPPRDKKRPR